MSKQFLYCENCEGGMSSFLFEPPDVTPLHHLYGWMDRDCIVADTQLSEWINQAEVGEMANHRLGLCVRLKDAVRMEGIE